MIRLTERRLMAMTIAAGGLTLAAASAAVGMAGTSGGHSGAAGRTAAPGHAVALGPVSAVGPGTATTADPFLCVAYAHTWGICIGPPTS